MNALKIQERFPYPAAYAYGLLRRGRYPGIKGPEEGIEDLRLAPLRAMICGDL